MRIVRFSDDQGQIHLGQIPAGDIPAQAQLLDGDLFGGLKPTGKTARIARLLAPLSPVNIFCIGLNYREHAKESNSPIPENPVVFMKPTTCATNPGDAILLPKTCNQGPEVDYECELAIVIGKKARDVSEADALSYVLGYTAANDVSARKWQRNGGGGQWIRGKSFDTFCPLGPAIVTAGGGDDSIADPQALKLTTTIDGNRMQDGCTDDMIFPVRTLVSFLSRDTTLLPGTIILTGTPPGVGFARNPPAFLKAGDQVTVEVEKVGKLTNPVKAG
ncbi:MAG: fumarylacetoacetate hydrolase family protein [Phycisphaeraceae bacterium]